MIQWPQKELLAFLFITWLAVVHYYLYPIFIGGGLDVGSNQGSIHSMMLISSSWPRSLLCGVAHSFVFEYLMLSRKYAGGCVVEVISVGILVRFLPFRLNQYFILIKDHVAYSFFVRGLGLWVEVFWSYCLELTLLVFFHSGRLYARN